jgi:hypothetical protein
MADTIHLRQQQQNRCHSSTTRHKIWYERYNTRRRRHSQSLCIMRRPYCRVVGRSATPATTTNANATNTTNKNNCITIPAAFMTQQQFAAFQNITHCALLFHHLFYRHGTTVPTVASRVQCVRSPDLDAGLRRGDARVVPVSECVTDRGGTVSSVDTTSTIDGRTCDFSTTHPNDQEPFHHRCLDPPRHDAFIMTVQGVLVVSASRRHFGINGGTRRRHCRHDVDIAPRAVLFQNIRRGQGPVRDGPFHRHGTSDGRADVRRRHGTNMATTTTATQWQWWYNDNNCNHRPDGDGLGGVADAYRRLRGYHVLECCDACGRL